MAYSNAWTNPVLIYRDPVDNVPQPMRDEYVTTLAQALNTGVCRYPYHRRRHVPCAAIWRTCLIALGRNRPRDQSRMYCSTSVQLDS